METYYDGGEKANFNIFHKKDIILDNMETERPRKLSTQTLTSKKSHKKNYLLN
jgi:hypothetical protein